MTVAPLSTRLAARIRAGGPLDMAAYVDAALYDAEGGFYTRGPRLGRGGAFATAPTAHPAFADAVAAEARAAWEALGRPAPFAVIEAGPGDGTLAAALAERLADLPLELVLVERAAGMRRRQEERLADRDVAWVADPGDVAPRAGLVVANELLDALPFRLLAWPDEVVVDVAADGRLVERRRPAAGELLALLDGVAPRRGARYAVRPELPGVVAALVGMLAAGRVVLVDYGGEGAEIHDGRRDPVRTYVAGQPGGGVLAAPGRQDITADVDFGQVRRTLRARGLRERWYGSQPAWLRAHGAALPIAERRSHDDWVLAGLLDERLPFRVLVAEAPAA